MREEEDESGMCPHHHCSCSSSLNHQPFPPMTTHYIAYAIGLGMLVSIPRLSICPSFTWFLLGNSSSPFIQPMHVSVQLMNMHLTKGAFRTTTTVTTAHSRPIDSYAIKILDAPSEYGWDVNHEKVIQLVSMLPYVLSYGYYHIHQYAFTYTTVTYTHSILPAHIWVYELPHHLIEFMSLSSSFLSLTSPSTILFMARPNKWLLSEYHQLVRKQQGGGRPWLQCNYESLTLEKVVI